MICYSLWDRPWIPVIRRSGERSMLGIRDALVQAKDMREIYDPSPLITVAIHRLLLAILYRVYHPRNAKDWVELWRAERFDPDQLDEYGALYADKFDLFHQTHPFYQVPFMAGEKVHPISAIILEAASGHNPTLFDHGKAEGGKALTPDRAACHLVAHQLFAVGGGISKPFNLMDGPLTKGLVVEAKSRNTLFETLLLNLIPLDHWTVLVPESERDRDLPFWELELPPEPAKNGTIPLGPMHYLTWQTRRIHLYIDESSGNVPGCQIQQRYCLPKNGEKLDPWKPYKKDKKKGWTPYKIGRQRAVWQFTHIILQTAEKNEWACPHLVRWLAKAKEIGKRESLTVPSAMMLSISGLGFSNEPGKAAKVILWRREMLPLPAEFLEDADLVEDLRELLAEAQRAESLLQRAGLVLVWVLGERSNLPYALTYFRTGKLPEGKKIPAQYKNLAPSLGMVTRFWPILEEPFRYVMEELPCREYEVVREYWQLEIRHAAVQSFQAARDGLLHIEGSYEVLARVDDAFNARLHRLFVEKEKTEEDEGGDVGDEESDE